MNFNRRFFTLFLCSIIAILCNNSYAQVVIGSITKPESGAVLQLKQDGTFTDGVNATKGLGMPRIKLTAHSGDLATTMGAVAGSYDAQGHIGLMIYATEKYSVFPLRCPGLAVWDGTEWQQLASPPSYPNIAMTDIDGNQYNAKFYAVEPCDPLSDGAYWITSNLYVTQKNTGGVFTSNPEATTNKDEVRLNPALHGHVGLVPNTNAIAIAVGGLSDVLTVSFGESENTIATLNKTITQRQFAQRFGLLYTLDQAKEACPTDWHLPTDKDWANLNIILGGWHQTSKVMRANSNWYRPINADKSDLIWAIPDQQVGISGFDALPSGVVNRDGIWASDFSNYAIWRTSGGKMRGLGAPAYFQDYLLSPTTSDQSGNDISGNHYYAVRCVKYK